MNDQLTPDQIRELSVAERLQLIEDVWETLCDAPTTVPVPDWHREELDARMAAHEIDPAAARPWADVKAEILRSLRK
jgi:putative addiction module component (TIGR02574 family)